MAGEARLDHRSVTKPTDIAELMLLLLHTAFSIAIIDCRLGPRHTPACVVCVCVYRALIITVFLK